MKKPSSKYYPISDLADEWNWKIKDILHYGATGELQISYLVPYEPNPGPYLISKEDAGRFLENIGGLYSLKLKSLPESVKERWGDQRNLVITHEEKSRFEATCDMASGNDIGEKERITWLRIIYLLMRKLANHQSNLAKPSGVNVSQLAEVLKKAAKEYDLSDAGLSKSTLSKIYDEALESLMPHTK